MKNLLTRIAPPLALAAIVLATVLAASPISLAANYIVLHTFTERDGDGGVPYTGLIFDAAGNLYGATSSGGFGVGTVYELSPNSDGGWSQKTIYNFAGTEGVNSTGSITFGPDGAIYGTSLESGRTGRGGIFRLKQGANGVWSETPIYRFSGYDGEFPTGTLAFDATGDLYGATYSGGAFGKGVVFNLHRTAAGWQQTVLYNFTGGTDGCQPWGGVVLDASGNLFGTTFTGGNGSCIHGDGVVFELSPSPSGWSESTVLTFNGLDGGWSYAGLIFDASGNLYGDSTFAGAQSDGDYFKLSRTQSGWKASVLASSGVSNGYYPVANLTFDADGNLYGTNSYGGDYGSGTVFKLSPNGEGEPWTYTVLYRFHDSTDGGVPLTSVAVDAGGNVYGTASQGGDPSCQCGVVFEITP